ncbi:hypothetical protein NDU88_005671 [Pleurodeles waltl]|uniref:Uncharacterized protein n=1 Tax=Pleurodeles waltl TaxID=8319 RepID=A0AAV7L1H5_PLEWA|nr:hypothetical protein NDU88_005671 [Pleurodeles waltl]
METEIGRAWLVKEDQQRAQIRAIKLEDGMVINAQADIKNVFEIYYQALYAATDAPRAGQLEQLFRNLPLLTLTHCNRSNWRRPFNLWRRGQLLRRLPETRHQGLSCITSLDPDPRAPQALTQQCASSSACGSYRCITEPERLNIPLAAMSYPVR